MQSVIKWLEANHLNHAAIVLLGMWPVSLITSTPWDAALVLSFGYYMREVTQYARLGMARSLFPWLWNFHDWVQTVYAITAAYLAALFLSNIF